MKTKLDYYRVFYEAARHSSISVAAKNLYISQSAISQCIRQLEEDLETTLFVRSRRGAVLTKEGQLLFTKVENAILSLEQGEVLLAKLQRLDAGSLVIAAGDTITTSYLLPLLEKFHETYPNIKIEMANSYSSRLLEFVKEGKAELAFINLPVQDSDLYIEPLFTVHDIFVCSKDHKQKRRYSWKEMAAEPLILLEENSISRKHLNKVFLEKGVLLNPHLEMAAHDLLIRFASINLGVSCVVEEFSNDRLKNGDIKKMNLVPPLPERSIGCAYLSEESLSPAAKAFLELVHNDYHPQK